MRHLTYMQEFSRIASLPDEQVDLARASLLIASLEYPDLDIEQQLGLLDSRSAAAAPRIAPDTDPPASVNQLREPHLDHVG